MSRFRELTNPRALAVLVVLLAIVVLFILTRAASRNEVDFLAGPKDSTFYLDALEYKERLAPHGVTVNVIETAGTIENLKRIVDAEVPTATFADAVQGIRDQEEKKLEKAAAPGEEPEESEFESISSLGAIYLQPLWVFALEGTEVSDLQGFRGQRVRSAREGSSARLLAALVLRETGVEKEIEFDRVAEVEEVSPEKALAALRSGQVAALLFMGQPDAPLINALLRAPDVRAMPITRAEAFPIHFPFLKAVRLPRGGVDLREDIPPENLQMIAASSELLVSSMFPAPIADLMLQAATEIHGGPSLFSGKEEFPNPDMVSIDLNASAAKYYKEGPPLLHKVLPFRLATWIDRFFMVVVGFGSAAIALFSVVPRVIELSFNRKLTEAYRRIEAIEKSIHAGVDREAAQAELDALERETSDFKILLRSMIAPYMEMRQNLHDLRERVEG